MAEPKKETVRIALPARPESASPNPSVSKADTARIVLPSRTPITPVRRLPPGITPLPSSEFIGGTPNTLPRRPPVSPLASSSPLLQPLPKPPGIEKNPAFPATIHSVPPRRDENAPVTPAANRGPKNETARISILPHPHPVVPAVNMTKTQPLLIHPAGTVQPAPIVITSKPIAPIPRPLCWALLAISALIFLIQIWNYVVS